MSKICPVYLKVKKDEYSNYRPITIMYWKNIIKTCEYWSELSKNIEENNIIKDNQHGFQKGWKKYYN